MVKDHNNISLGSGEKVDGPDDICRRHPERCDPDPPIDHRRHRRLLLEGLVVSVQSNGSSVVQAHVHDVSSEGLCLQLEPGLEFTTGQAVNVWLDGGDPVLSLVTHVNEDHVGIWFGEPAPPEAADLINRLTQAMR